MQRKTATEKSFNFEWLRIFIPKDLRPSVYLPEQLPLMFVALESDITATPITFF